MINPQAVYIEYCHVCFNVSSFKIFVHVEYFLENFRKYINIRLLTSVFHDKSAQSTTPYILNTAMYVSMSNLSRYLFMSSSIKHNAVYIEYCQVCFNVSSFEKFVHVEYFRKYINIRLLTSVFHDKPA